MFDSGDQVVRAREEDAGDAEAEDGLESGRDRSKPQKFKKMLAEESLPAAVLAEYQSCGSRDDKTKLINTLFGPSARKSGWRPQTRRRRRRRASARTCSCPSGRSRMVKLQEGGKEYYAAAQIERERKSSKQSNKQIEGQAVEFDEDQSKEVKKLWSKMTPDRIPELVRIWSRRQCSLAKIVLSGQTSSPFGLVLAR